MDITLTIKYMEGYGWQPSFVSPDINYRGEYQPTLDEAVAKAKKALATYSLLGLTA